MDKDNVEKKVEISKGSVVDAETAQNEVERFMDLKRLSDKKRETLKANIKGLMGSVEAGLIRFDFERKRTVATLTVPLNRKVGKQITELDMRFNMGVKVMLANTKGAGLEEGNEHSLYMLSSLCDIPVTILENAMNDEGEQGLAIADFNMLRDYALFFLA